jgi:hypothetical protein
MRIDPTQIGTKQNLRSKSRLFRGTAHFLKDRTGEIQQGMIVVD